MSTAVRLGYEEPASFYRVFRGWTGKTPERVRVATLSAERLTA